MTTDEIGLLDGPEMDALRELRADVPGPTDAQRQAAWERVQGARSQAGTRGRRGGRAWLLAGAAAVAAGVVAGGIALSVGADHPTPPASSSDQSAATPTNPNPTPFATGSVWEPSAGRERQIVDAYREGVVLTPKGGVRIEIPGQMDWEAMTKATNAEGVPVRFWAVEGEPNAWETGPRVVIDPEDGIDMSQEGLPAYPMDGITFERSGGAGSPVTAVVIDHVPTEPVDITFTQ